LSSFTSDTKDEGGATLLLAVVFEVGAPSLIPFSFGTNDEGGATAPIPSGSIQYANLPLTRVGHPNLSGVIEKEDEEELISLSFMVGIDVVGSVLLLMQRVLLCKL
jgi:hypothetical protein